MSTRVRSRLTDANAGRGLEQSGNELAVTCEALSRAHQAGLRDLAALWKSRRSVMNVHEMRGKEGLLTGGRDEFLMEVMSEERVRQRPEVVLHTTRHGGKIVELVSILQVKVLLALEMLRDEFRLSHSSRLSVDPLVSHAYREREPSVSARLRGDERAQGLTMCLDRLDTFRHDDGNFSILRLCLDDLRDTSESAKACKASAR